ncbi:unnamed protein product [Arctogadus glacialis]
MCMGEGFKLLTGLSSRGTETSPLSTSRSGGPSCGGLMEVRVFPPLPQTAAERARLGQLAYSEQALGSKVRPTLHRHLGGSRRGAGLEVRGWVRG